MLTANKTWLWYLRLLNSTVLLWPQRIKRTLLLWLVKQKSSNNQQICTKVTKEVEWTFTISVYCYSKKMWSCLYTSKVHDETPSEHLLWISMWPCFMTLIKCPPLAIRTEFSRRPYYLCVLPQRCEFNSCELMRCKSEVRDCQCFICSTHFLQLCALKRFSPDD